VITIEPFRQGSPYAPRRIASRFEPWLLPDGTRDGKLGILPSPHSWCNDPELSARARSEPCTIVTA
jgi:hypothetical protein